MSYLDRLKREAEAQRLTEEAAHREREQREQLFRDQIDPRMRRLLQDLEAAIRTLIDLKPAFRARMNIVGYGDLAAQSVWDYRLEHERRHRGWVLQLYWTWRVDPEQSPVVRADSAHKVKVLTSAFRQHQLGGIKDELRNRAGDVVAASFHPRGQIRARMEAQISADDPVLRLLFTNASWLGSSQRQVPWQHIDAGLSDKLVRFLAREDDSLFTEEFASHRPDAQATAGPASELATGPAIGTASAPGTRPTSGGGGERAAAPRDLPAATPETLPAAPAAMSGATAAVTAAPAPTSASASPPAQQPAEPEPEPEPELPTMDDVLESLPDPTAALIAALGGDEDSDEAGSRLSALAADDWGRPRAPVRTEPVPPPVAQPVAPTAPSRALPGGPSAVAAAAPSAAAAPAAPTAPATAPAAPAAPATAGPATAPAAARQPSAGLAANANDDFEPLTRTELALIEKLRRKASAMGASAAATTPGAAPVRPGDTDAAPVERQRIDAAAFDQRLRGTLSRLREDPSDAGRE